jgi:hypothetical protein
MKEFDRMGDKRKIKDLEKLAHEAFYKRLRALRGQLTFDDFDLAELREDRDLDDCRGGFRPPARPSSS